MYFICLRQFLVNATFFQNLKIALTKEFYFVIDYGSQKWSKIGIVINFYQPESKKLTQVVYSQTGVNLITFSILDHFQWENGHNPLQQSWITIKSQPFPPKKLDLSVLSIWIGYRINWIISEVQASKIFFFIFLASKKLLAPLRSRIGTCLVFCHSFSVSHGVS